MSHVSRLGSGIKSIDEVIELNGDSLTLNLHCNSLTSLRLLHKFTKLVEINVSDNRITSIDGLNGLYQLTALNLASNRVQDCTGLGGLSKLKRLHLQYNLISSLAPLVDLQSCAAGLEYVDVRGNAYEPSREYCVLSNLRNIKQLIVDHPHGGLQESNRTLSIVEAQSWVRNKFLFKSKWTLLASVLPPGNMSTRSKQ
jgi:hypothetical protein